MILALLLFLDETTDVTLTSFVHSSSRTASRCQDLVELGMTCQTQLTLLADRRSTGAKLCDSPASIINQNVDIVIAMAGYPSDLEEIVYGHNGLVEGRTDNETDITIPLTLRV